MSVYYLLEKEGDTTQPKKISFLKKDGSIEIECDGQQTQYDVVPLGPNRYSLIIDGRSHLATVVKHNDSLIVDIDNSTHELMLVDQKHYQTKKRRRKQKKDGSSDVVSPMPGKVVDILVEKGQSVKEGDGLIVIEAMKMENELKATSNGIIQEINVSPGEAVDANKTLIILT